MHLIRKILIVAPSWVGDMVMGQTLLKLLKQQENNCQIDVLVNNWALDVVKRMPEVSKVHSNPFKHGEFALLKRIKLGLQLRHEKYDQVFVMANSFKSALVPFFAGIPKRTGFLGEMRYGLLNDYFKLDKQALPLMIDRFCALANNGKKPANIQYPQFNVDHIQQAKVLANLGLKLDLPVICLCPAAEYGPAKRWPSAHFAELANKLQELGYQVWIMGSSKDQALAEEIIQAAKVQTQLYNLCGRTDLVEVIDLLACAKVVVSNDSGLMHVACAVNVPVIAVYGSSSPDFTPPLSNLAIIEQLSLDCSPCFARTCKYGHYNCLQLIKPEMILNQINKLECRG